MSIDIEIQILNSTHNLQDSVFLLMETYSYEFCHHEHVTYKFLDFIVVNLHDK